MTDDSLDPFAHDSAIPDIPTGGDNDSLSLDDDFSGFSQPAPPRSRLPWLLIAGIVGGLFILGLVAVVATTLLPDLIDPPDKTVRAYYEALEVQDFDRLTGYIDPDDNLAGNVLPMMATFKQQIEQLFGDQLGVDLKLAWKFQDLTFKTIEQSRTAAKVQVTGRIRVYDTGTGLGLSFPYDWTHELVRKNGRWYLRPY